MTTFAFDRKGPHGFVPNLVSTTDIEPGTVDWEILCLTPPYSEPLNLLKYLDLENIPYSTVLVEDAVGPVIYPIQLSYFDPAIDYFALISERAREMCRAGDLKIVFYYTEGDNPGLYIDSTISRLCEQHAIDKANVRFVIANRAVNDKAPYIYFPDDELRYRMLARDSDYVKNVNVRPRTKKFTCLTRADKGFRRLFGATLWYQGLSDQGYFSYGGVSYDVPGGRADPVFKWNKLWQDAPGLMENFNMHVPFRADDLTDEQHLDSGLIHKPHYTDAYWNFVLESNFSKNTVHLSEKTFKPILNMQPFVVVGAPGSLKLLHELGYETFNEWIDESYDKIKNDEERLHACFQILYELSYMSDADLIRMIKEMIPVLAHNQQLLLNTKRDKLEDLLKKIQ